MKTKMTVELRKIKNGQLFRYPPTNVLYVRGDYSPRFFSFKCYRFDSVEVAVMISANTPVARVDFDSVQHD